MAEEIVTKGQIEDKQMVTGPFLLTADDIAYRLRISRAMAYNLMKTGMITTVHIGKAVRVRQEDLDAFILKSIRQD